MKIKLITALIVVTSLGTQFSSAQGLADGFFNKKGEANIALSYTFATFDKFYLGNTEVDGVPAHNSIDQTIINAYVNYGISDKLAIMASVPYIKAEGFGVADPVNGSTEESGIQDISVLVKYSAFVRSTDHGTVTGIVGLGGSYAFDYEPNGILSIGNGAPAFDAKLGLHYKNNSGFFGTAFVGYTLRGEADNNFNVGDGSAFDVPNSLNTQIKFGYTNKILYLDAWFDAQTTNGSIDIAGPGFFGNFPETKVEYSRVGLDVYVPITKAIGISGGAGTVVGGRNVGKGTFYTGGLVVGLGK